MPKEIYEHPQTVEHAVIENDTTYLHIDHIEVGKGINIFVKDHPYPYKSSAVPQSIWAINIAKSLLKSYARRPWTFSRKSFNEVAWRALEPYILKYQFLSPTAQGIYELLRGFSNSPEGEKMAKIIAHVVEYDSAYRFRLMDLFNETTQEKLAECPVREIGRLVAINRARDYGEVSDKIKMFGYFRYLIPFFKRRWVKAVYTVNYTLLTFDEADTYWAKYKTDYNYFGTNHAKKEKKV